MADDAMLYRFPTARVTSVLAVTVTLAAVAGAIMLPSRELSAAIPIVGLAGWLAWVLWGYPLIRIDRAAVVVRDSFRTVEIPLTAIAEVSGGRKLTIRTFDGRTYVPAAAPGMGTSFVWGAVRATKAYGDSIVPVKGVEVLRIDPERERTPATIVAQTIRRRIEQLGPAPAGARTVPPPRINVDIILTTAGIAAAAAALFAILA